MIVHPHVLVLLVPESLGAVVQDCTIGVAVVHSLGIEIVPDRRVFRQMRQDVINIKRAACRLPTLRHRLHIRRDAAAHRSEEHTSELQSLMRISYAVFCLKKKNTTKNTDTTHTS